ncbi:MAG: flagellar hook-associated protein FlgK [Pirellulaceae bacterium]|nr:flagellar hook-associated protein FlgK [Pirellulaceae bacterium]
MSLSGTIQLAANSLLAQQIGLQVIGNNIANAATPGYLRQQVDYVPAPTQERGSLRLGLGVRVQGITSQVNQFVQDRLRRATSELEAAVPQEAAYIGLEGIIGELGDKDLSTALNRFFGSLNDILAEPGNSGVRTMAVSQAQVVTDELNRLDRLVRQQHADVNEEIVSLTSEFNNYIAEIAELNLKIVQLEGGGTIASDAVGLRDQREAALSKLSEIIDIQAIEDKTGSVSVFAGGDFLVMKGQHREVKTVFTQKDRLTEASIHIVQTESEVQHTSGKLAGLLAARDEVLNGFLQKLDDFTLTLIQEFNRRYSSGLGVIGHSQLTAEVAVEDPEEVLDEVGLPFTPQSGLFQIKVRNLHTGSTDTTDIAVDLNGFDDDTSLRQLAEAIDAVPGISANLIANFDSTTLQVSTDGTHLEFDFANDTSGVIAALGLGTFFTGSSAGDAGVRQELMDRPETLATSRHDFGQNTEVALELAGLLDEPLESGNGSNLTTLYDQLAGGTIQASAVSRSVTDGLRLFQETIQGEHLAISGVNLDEEAVQLITHQRAFQASAKLIATVSELLEILTTI